MSYKKQLEELSSLSQKFDAGLTPVHDAEFLPLSFFSQSYDLLKEMTSLLHALEMDQLEKMQRQMKEHKEMMEAIQNPKDAVPFIFATDEVLKDHAPEEIQIELPEEELKIEEPKVEVKEVEPTRAEPKEAEKKSKEIFDTLPLKEVLEKKMLSDLRKAISLNDKFRFQRELFAGDSNTMNVTIDALSVMTSLDDALVYVESRFRWNWEEEAAADFRVLLEKIYV